jgi:hypothetical protein
MGQKLELGLLGFLDLAFFEDDVLAGDGVVFLQFKLLGVVFGVLFGHVEKARICRADQLDIVLCFSHFVNPKILSFSRERTGRGAMS